MSDIKHELEIYIKSGILTDAMKEYFDRNPQTIEQIRNFYAKKERGIKEGAKEKPQVSANEISPDLENDIRKYIVSKVGGILHIEDHKIDTTENFMDLGIESQNLVSLSHEIENDLNIELYPTLFFEYKNIDDLSEYLYNSYQVQFSKFFGKTIMIYDDFSVKESPVNEMLDNIKTNETFNQQKTYLRKIEGLPHCKGDLLNLSTKKGDSFDPVAIIGISGIMPGSENLGIFWKHLVEEKDMISRIPVERWEGYGEDAFLEQDPPVAQWGGFIDGVDKFDARFFNISPKEAELMDPQQRILMEVVWAAVEDAGYKAGELSGTKTGLFMGVANSGYDKLIINSGMDMEAQTSSGNALSMITNRISFFMNIHGPSIPIDTACSSSLVAVDMAVESLHRGESEIAIAGGVNALVIPDWFVSFNKAGMLSPDGRCKTFDKDADGYVRGEGAGAIVLKPLSKAERDGDHIYAVIKGCSVNHGGKASSLTAPNPNAQAELMVSAWKKSKLDPSTIGYIEAHGTGTSLGDPIEINGVKMALEELYNQWNIQYPKDGHQIGIGSVKTNIGHLETASGIAGLLKVVLAMKNKKIPASIHLKELNPFIKLENSPLYIVNKTLDWEAATNANGMKLPRRAGVSSFGFGGANAHIVIEEYEKTEASSQHMDIGPKVIVLSAKSPERLREYAKNLAEFIEEQIESHKNNASIRVPLSLTQLAYTLQTGREAMEERLAFVASDLREAAEILKKYSQQDIDQGLIYTGNAKSERLLIKEFKDINLIENLATDNKLSNIAQLWVQGMEIEWTVLYKDLERMPTKLPLPTYPFERTGYWVTNTGKRRVLFDTPDFDGYYESGEEQLSGLDLTDVEYTEEDLKQNRLQSQLIQSKTENLLKEVFGKVLRIEPEKIDLDTGFTEYGIDSIMINDFNSRIEKYFGKLPKTILFEFKSIRDVVKYLIQNYEETLIKLFQLDGGQTRKNERQKAGESGNRWITHNRNRKSIGAGSSHKNAPGFVNEEIAIVGLSGRYPQAANLYEFWENLKAGKDSIVEIPKSRWDFEAYYDPDTRKALEGKSYGKWGGFIEDEDKFDPLFFSISPREAETMDPQERLFLEAAWWVLEDAGYTRKDIKEWSEKEKRKSVGVFAGITTNTYLLYGPDEWRKGNAVIPNSYPWSVANRVSYILNLNGPSMPVDTACSSALTAIHLACESIRKGECSMAIAGGVNLHLHPSKYVGLSQMNMLSPTGRCHAFGADGDGYVPGEGVGAVLLKPLNQALEDGDHIYALIKGSALNHGGTTNGYTVPSPTAHEDLIHEALKSSGINPRTVSYIEAHGTGTALGDPIEIAGLTKAFGKFTDDRQFCSIGSVKSNIGHLESAAGIVSLTKVLLQMKYKKLLPSIHTEKLNPNITFEDTPFYVQRELTDWNQPVLEIDGKQVQFPRRAGISSFGAGGSNAHIIVEEYNAETPDYTKDSGEKQLIVLSARNEERLREYALRMAEYFKQEVAMGMENEESSLELKALLEEDVLQLLAANLQVEANELNKDDNLKDCGLDVVTFSKVIDKINEKYYLDINAKILAHINSVNSIITYILNTYSESLLKLYPKTDFQEHQRAGSKELNLRDIAYTLQIGREQMAERAAFIVSDVQELISICMSLANDNQEAHSFYRGNTRKTKSTLLFDDNEDKKYLNTLMDENKFDKLAKLWVMGVDMDWKALYKSKTPRRVSLPVYPFARERYWIPVREENNIQSTFNASQLQFEKLKLHPLIDINTSNLNEQKYETSLVGSEFYLKDHIVNGEKVLPGVVYIEMARVSGELAGDKKVKKIRNIVWQRPIKVLNDPQQAYISLSPVSSSQVDFVVGLVNDTKNRTMHAKGELIYSGEVDINVPHQGIDLEAIKGRCTGNKSSQECYRFFDSIGLSYGETFRPIQNIYNNNAEALALLVLPEAIASSIKEFVLHPSLLDGSLQAVLGLMMNQRNDKELYLPYSMEEITIWKPLSERCYAYIRYSTEQEQSSKDSKVFDLSLTDENGNILVDIKGFSVRILRDFKATADEAGNSTAKTLYLKGVWKESENVSVSGVSLNKTLIFDMDDRLYELLKERKDVTPEQILRVRTGESFRNPEKGVYEINPQKAEDYLSLMKDIMQKNLLPEKIIHFWSADHLSYDDAGVEEQLQTGIYSLFNLSKALIENKLKDTIRVLYIYEARDMDSKPLYSSAGGFIRSIRMENTKCLYKLLGINNLNSPHMLDQILAEFNEETRDDIEIRLMEEKRYVLDYEDFDIEKEQVRHLPLREKGVYLITGGAGKLGLLFAKYFAKNVKARLILTGRSELSEDKSGFIEELEKAGSEVMYCRADISKKSDVENLVAKAKDRFGEINGVLHTAGLIIDSYIHKKSKEEFEKVLRPKIHGTIYLDQATKDENLDFFVMFSSIASLSGNMGQSDYSYANRFLDHYAIKRVMDKRSGITLSINWPLWKEGGMNVDDETKKMMEKTMGMRVLETDAGIEALEKGLMFSGHNFLVIQGDEQKIKRVLVNKKKENLPKVQMTEAVEVKTENSKLDIIQKELIEMVSEVLKVQKSNIDIEADMNEYGFDSISVTGLMNKINEKFGTDISPAVFYEYTNIESFSKHLYQTYSEKFNDYYKEKMVRTPVLEKRIDPVTIKTEIEPKQEDIPVKSRFIPKLGESSASITMTVDHRGNHEPIAVVGINGVMPQSENLLAFWNNLQNGIDMISEIPSDRWDWKEIYGDTHTGENKTKVKWGGFMPSIDTFDPMFFGISPHEAELMDPQQRIFLEVVWKTIEDAGYKPSDLSGSKTGLFVGVAASDYHELVVESGITTQSHTATGLSHCVLANRISYLLNLHGPSEPIDTACSSSLVAVHRAIESIRNGDCDMAIAGGINVITNPRLYVAFTKAGMLCEDGRCKTFDSSANGYVRSEGAGALFLKPLSRAVKDGDHIYALIKGSAVNHGGKVNSLTTPNPNAQAELIKTAWTRAAIDPATVTYIEVHGTGTSLGDPIEINGLKKAFEELSKKWGKQYPQGMTCGIGSIKSNLGHLETAAGMGGLLKIILSMKQKVIPGNLHFKALNPYIQLEGSPFYIVDKTIDWNTIEDQNYQTIPRRAGISSFGFGGANAHVVLEEYVSPVDDYSEESDKPQLIVLSAKNEQRLRTYAKELAEFVEEMYGYGHDKKYKVGLDSVAYTLQTGREAMEVRLAFVAATMEEVVGKLVEISQDGMECEGIYWGNIDSNKTQKNLLNGKAGEEYLKILFAERDYDKLASIWSSGIDINFRMFYQEKRMKRVPLATYPFERKRYWIPEEKNTVVEYKNRLHPLVQQNISDAKGFKYTTRLSGNEFYIADHLVNKEKVLPGAAYVEMMRAASVLFTKRHVTHIKDVIWKRPLKVNDSMADINIYLYLDDVSADIGFEIADARDEDNLMIFCQGIAELDQLPGNQDNISCIDIGGIKSRCKEYMEKSECYLLYSGAGLDYGPGFQTIQHLYYNENESFARIELPAHLTKEYNDYLLHPSILDGAFQAALPLVKSAGELYVPASMDSIQIMGQPSSSCFVYVKQTAQGENADYKKYDIQIADENGVNQVLIEGFTIQLYPSLKVQDSSLECQIVNNNNHGIQERPIQEVAYKEPTTANDIENVKFKTESMIKEILAKEIKLSSDKIRNNETFERYGIDSMIIVKLNKQMESMFGDVPKTLFFEYRNISELADYFMNNHKDKLAAMGIYENEFQKGSYEKDARVQEIKALPAAGISERPVFNKNITVKQSQNYINKNRDIAIIGLDGRYPEAENLEKFWQNLVDGRDCISEIPLERWDYKKYFEAVKNKQGKIYSKWGGFIQDVDKFDPLFFGISPRDAELMDPQERLFLETVWNTLEDAGYTRFELSKHNVGVFVGVMYGEYQLLGLEEYHKGNRTAVSNFYASIANRISYYFDLHGPSIAMDTMCSSSLTAIHLACESINRGEIDYAFAGGVNVSLHPYKYIQLSQGKFASSEGRCRSFGEGGDGYVPGEGVGAVLLKPLHKAVQDRDHIYGVIKASSLNHGGRTNSFTVPNPKAQAQLISNTLKKTDINPRSISYMEAHGTGTSLGDPIEITGLTKAFSEYTMDRGFCPIGSVKSNIGHLESAAGISGLTKILLQMKHKKLVPSILSEKLNPNIDFENSPFYVQYKYEDWKKPQVAIDGIVREYPRRAALSSFGAGGSNAHLIIEEYIGYDRNKSIGGKKGGYLFVISARNEDRVKACVKSMIGYIDNLMVLNDENELLADSIAYTLQTGREWMDERIAIIAESIAEFRDKLMDYDKGVSRIKGLYASHMHDIKENVQEVENTVSSNYEAIFREGDLDKIARLWVMGENIDFRQLYSNRQTPYKVSLPKYPFSKKSYWIPKGNDNLMEGDQLPMLHPMLAKNSSTIWEEKFSSRFTGEEFFIRGHIVGGKKIMPGAAYIEMARAAGEMASEENIVKIKDVHWMRPMVFGNEPVDTEVVITMEEEDCMGFEIYSLRQGERDLHSRGKMLYSSHQQRTELDVEAIKSRCKKQARKEECYALFKSMGFEYGEAFQGIEELVFNEEECFGRIIISPDLMKGTSRFVLNPCILDGALQSVIGLMISRHEKENRLFLPYKIKEIDIFEALPLECFTYVTLSKKDSSTEGDKIFDIAIADLNGKVCVQIKGFIMEEKKQQAPRLNETSLKDALYKLSKGDADREKIVSMLEDYIHG